MASPTNFQCSKPTFHLKMINPKRRSSPQTLLFPSFSTDFSKSTPISFPIIKASSSASSSNPRPSLLKTTCIALTTSAVLFSASFNLVTKPALATTVTQETFLETQSSNVEALLSLAKIKFDAENYDQAIKIINRMIEIDPEEQQWRDMRARILLFTGCSQAAIKALEEILAKDPIRVEAYHYLVMVYYNSKPKVIELEKRIKKAIRRCEKEQRTKEIRDFKMLIALIRLCQGNPNEAIKICDALVRDDPGVLVQLIMYMWKKTREDVKQQPENGKTKVSNWGVIVAYDPIECYIYTMIKLLIASGGNWSYEFDMKKLKK